MQGRKEKTTLVSVAHAFCSATATAVATAVAVVLDGTLVAESAAVGWVTIHTVLEYAVGNASFGTRPDQRMVWVRV
jgi:hypothetical protein